MDKDTQKKLEDRIQPFLGRTDVWDYHFNPFQDLKEEEKDSILKASYNFFMGILREEGVQGLQSMERQIRTFIERTATERDQILEERKAQWEQMGSHLMVQRYIEAGDPEHGKSLQNDFSQSITEHEERVAQLSKRWTELERTLNYLKFRLDLLQIAMWRYTLFGEGAEEGSITDELFAQVRDALERMEALAEEIPEKKVIDARDRLKIRELAQRLQDEVNMTTPQIDLALAILFDKQPKTINNIRYSKSANPEK